MQPVTRLVKVIECEGESLHSSMLCMDYRGIKFKILRGEMRSNDVEECKKYWVWINIEQPSQMYKKHVVCPEFIYHQMINKHHQLINEKSKKEREEKS